MKLFGNWEIRKTEKREAESSIFGSMSYGSFSSYQSSKALTLSSCYRAVNLISDAIASLQMKVYDVDANGFKSEAFTDPLYSILGYEPNANMSRFNFYKLIITSILLRGNAYIKINRDNNFIVKSLEFLNPDSVTITTVKNEIKFIINGVNGLVNNSDMIHVVNFPQMNTYYGVSTLTYAANTLDISYNSETHAGNFFKGGANFSGFLSTTAAITPKQEQDLINKFKNASNASTGSPNGIVMMGGAPDLKLQTLGISPRDSQLIETRTFNVLDIARFFNVNPILLFDNTKATFSNVESAQLDFLNTTLLPVIEKLENEFSRKLILPSQRNLKELRFDLSNLLRADSNSRVTYYKSLFEMGVISANQIAKELMLPVVTGVNADEHFISTNLQQLNSLIVNQTNSIDNKLL